MKLLDSCLSPVAADELRQLGYDVIWVGDWPHDPGDPQILARANDERRVLITLDKDFGELAVVHRLPHAGIVRLVDVTARDQATTTKKVADRYAGVLEMGAIVTVEALRTRVRLEQDELDE